jgi:RNA polymerase sigma factor (TIGR02999 family)
MCFASGFERRRVAARCWRLHVQGPVDDVVTALFERTRNPAANPTRGVSGTGIAARMRADASRDDVLDRLRSGRREALDELTALLYNELREIAHRQRANDDATLVTTALVHEAYLKLVDQSRASWNDRAHFLALAAVVMRHILTDRARARLAAKRGGNSDLVTLDDDTVASEDQPGPLLQIHEALDRLATVDERLARVVEYRFFGGLTHDEIAVALGLTVRTVERDWAKARVLLRDLIAA